MSMFKIVCKILQIIKWRAKYFSHSHLLEKKLLECSLEIYFALSKKTHNIVYWFRLFIKLLFKSDKEFKLLILNFHWKLNRKYLIYSDRVRKDVKDSQDVFWIATSFPFKLKSLVKYQEKRPWKLPQVKFKKCLK